MMVTVNIRRRHDPALKNSGGDGLVTYVQPNSDSFYYMPTGVPARPAPRGRLEAPEELRHNVTRNRLLVNSALPMTAPIAGLVPSDA
jgi:hypothetical protein